MVWVHYKMAVLYANARGALVMKSQRMNRIFEALDSFEIELPSWGFADTGTRFGKFFQEASASTTEEKFHDAGLVHQLTGACPTVAVHVLWDFKTGQHPREVVRLAEKYGVGLGSINPNLFQDQCYKLGSFCSPDAAARRAAMTHTLDCVEIGRLVKSKYLTFWLGDGTNYPGQDNIIRRKRDLQRAFRRVAETMPSRMTMLIEYKPFEPAFYHTDIADWGMAYVFCKYASSGMRGRRVKVLVDTGHHYQSVNIEHIVAFLLDEGMIGGFHFNDRKYADDDLTLGSIDPYATFRIFNQIVQHAFDTGKDPKLAYMIDQSHNLKPKIEAMVQSVDLAQRLFVKAHLVDRKALARAQQKGDVVAAERLLQDAYETDVRHVVRDWRASRKLPLDPLGELRSSGVINHLGRQRSAARKARGEVQVASYA